jgi:hypothetical protein
MRSMPTAPRKSRPSSAPAAFWKRRTRAGKIRLVLYPTLVLAIVGFGFYTMSMPQKSFRGALPPLTEDEKKLARLLQLDVESLASKIGERNTVTSGTLDRSWSLIENAFSDADYVPKRYPYRSDGMDVGNVEATVEGKGRTDQIVVIGAHYDSARGAPGADDNASGVAVLLALARHFRTHGQSRTIRFVAFVNEEPPHFWNASMGSLVYAKRCKEKNDDIVAMLSLESLGYYRDEPGSQKYPPVVSWFYPDRGNFVAFVGDLSSRSLVRDSIGAFRSAVSFPSEGAAMPSFIQGVGWSDQWSFWQVGYPGVMVTDTAPFRNPNYHTASDRAETLDYDRLARVTTGLIAVVEKLAKPQ